MKNLLTRAVTGAAYVAFIVAGLLISDLTVVIMCMLLALGGVMEFDRLGPGSSLPCRLLDAVGAVALVLAVKLPVAGGVAFVAYMTVRALAALYSRNRNAMNSLGRSLGGMVYVALPLALMAGAVEWRSELRWLFLAMFIMIWLNDTGAYLVGSQIGRHRLMERVSPKKSVEGFVGGLVFALAAAPALYYLVAGPFALISPGELLCVGAVVGIFGTLGDLVESRFKREAGVKDSGNILPGHGGVLDRIDSLLMVAPLTVAIAVLASL